MFYKIGYLWWREDPQDKRERLLNIREAKIAFGLTTMTKKAGTKQARTKKAEELEKADQAGELNPKGKELFEALLGGILGIAEESNLKKRKRNIKKSKR